MQFFVNRGIPKQPQESGIWQAARHIFEAAKRRGSRSTRIKLSDAGGLKDVDASEDKNRFLRLLRYSF